MLWASERKSIVDLLQVIIEIYIGRKFGPDTLLVIPAPNVLCVRCFKRSMRARSDVWSRYGGVVHETTQFRIISTIRAMICIIFEVLALIDSSALYLWHCEG